MTRDERLLLDEKYGGLRTPAYEADRERLAYVIGWQPFLGLKIYLDSKPLIPRPETEWWTEQLMSAISGTLHRSTDRAGRTFSAENDSVPGNRTHELHFLDLCAGSGAIGCAPLARLPNAQVYFGELDPAHEAIIRKNIRENGLDSSRADVRIGDLFEPFAGMQFDIIAANPPYVPANQVLPSSVAEYEPSGALYAGDDGLAVIRRIAKDLPKHLATGGVAWIECDTSHAEAVCALFARQGLPAAIRTDQYDKPRIIVVRPVR